MRHHCHSLFLSGVIACAFSAAAEMVLAADAVIQGRIVGAASRPGQQATPFQTSYRVEAVDVLHNYGRRVDEGQVVDVLRFGGSEEVSGRTIQHVVSEFPQFSTGSEFLFFLRWADQEQAWRIMWGPAGLVEVSQGRAKAWSKIGPLARVDSRDAAGVTRDLRLMRSMGKDKR